MLTSSGTSDSDFTPFGECMISSFHHMHYIICQSCDYVYRLMTLVCLPGLVSRFVSRLTLPIKFGKVEYFFRQLPRDKVKG